MPSFYPENNTSLPSDNEMRSLHKIVDMLGGAGSGSSGLGGGLAGTTDPEGIVAAKPGQVYTNTTTGSFWNKITGNGTTGWQELVA